MLISRPPSRNILTWFPPTYLHPVLPLSSGPPLLSTIMSLSILVFALSCRAFTSCLASWFAALLFGIFSSSPPAAVFSVPDRPPLCDLLLSERASGVTGKRRLGSESTHEEGEGA
ncbi:unnamed protein product [Pleuronectes platessa]|uniref:Uncharacterized protein n=1 Tax=Pleuronectes platessa TaxID=8262 RepID=A0A9N7ZBX7_PLEPL|nr:unnamed protein product [Pleuronectes platessa]